jgi:hypothetical protein
MPAFDRLSEAEKTEYRRLYLQFGPNNTDPRNRGALDVALRAEIEAIYGPQFVYRAPTDDSFSSPWVVYATGGGGDSYAQQYINFISNKIAYPQNLPLTPLLALSQDVGYFIDKPTLWEQFSKVAALTIIAVAGGAAVSGAGAATEGAAVGEVGAAAESGAYVAGSYDALEAGAVGTDAAAIAASSAVDVTASSWFDAAVSTAGDLASEVGSIATGAVKTVATGKVVQALAPPAPKPPALSPAKPQPVASSTPVSWFDALLGLFSDIVIGAENLLGSLFYAK